MSRLPKITGTKRYRNPRSVGCQHCGGLIEYRLDIGFTIFRGDDEQFYLCKAGKQLAFTNLDELLEIIEKRSKS